MQTLVFLIAKTSGRLRHGQECVCDCDDHGAALRERRCAVLSAHICLSPSPPLLTGPRAPVAPLTHRCCRRCAPLARTAPLHIKEERSSGCRPAAPLEGHKSHSHPLPLPTAARVKSQSGELHTNTLGPIFTFLRNHYSMLRTPHVSIIT